MVGIASLMPQQGQMPGQAQQAPLPGMMPKPGAATPTAEISQYAGMGLEELVALFQQRPSSVLLSKIEEETKAQQMRAAAQNQNAMAQAQQQPGTVKDMAIGKALQVMRPTQMAAHGGIMHGYAGGGAVAFENGGRTFGYAPDYELARKYGIDLSPYDAPEVRADKIKRARAMADFEEQRKSFGEIPTEASVARDAVLQQAYASPSRARDVLRTGITAAPTKPPVPPAQPARRPPTAAKPQGQGVASLMSGVEQTGTPAPDTLSDIESKGIADINALKNVLGKQGAVDPELMKLREAAYKSSQGIAERRERDRLAMLEAAQKASSASLFDNQEALLRMAGALGGAKRFGEGLSKVAGEAGTIKGEQRKELQRVQDIARQEQNAIDTLNQALADKRVADMTGDVNQRRDADRKVAEAQLKVTELRSGIQKERAAEADRAAQREIGRRTAGAQEKQAEAAMISARARADSDVASQRIALQAMRADPNYAAIVKELTEAKKMAGVSSSPTLQTRLRAAEKAARDLAASYGVTPGMMGMGGAGTPAPEGREIDFNAIGKK